MFDQLPDDDDCDVIVEIKKNSNYIPGGFNLVNNILDLPFIKAGNKIKPDKAHYSLAYFHPFFLVSL